MTAPLPLRVNDLLFVNEYLKNGQNGTQAYRVVHPGAKYQTAASRANDLLKKPSIVEEIGRRIQLTQVATAESLGSCLLKYRRWAEEKQDYLAAASIAMDHAKLAGLLVEKRANVTESPSVDRAALVEELRSRGLVPSS